MTVKFFMYSLVVVITGGTVVIPGDKMETFVMLYVIKEKRK